MSLVKSTFRVMGLIALWLIALSMVAVLCRAQTQVGNYGIRYQYNAPSGSCGSNSPLTVYQASGALYSCQNGSWAQVSGGGGGSTNWNSILNPTGNLSLTMAGDTSTFNYSSALANAFLWANITAATLSVSQSSPGLSLCGNAWTTASVQDCLTIQQVPGNGANAAISTVFAHSGSSTGIDTTVFPGPVQAGTASAAGLVGIPGNTTLPSLVTNAANFIGPNSASFTAYGLQFPATGPGAAGVWLNGAPTANVSQVSFGPLPLTDLATQAADTILINATGSAASPTAVSLASLGGTNSCAGIANAMTYNSTTHAFGCNTISGGGGSPGGSAGNLQYNSGGTAFGGISTLNYDGTNLADTGTVTNYPFYYATTVGPSSNTTLSATFTNAATSASVASTTGYCVPSANTVCYLAIQNGGANPEILSYTGTTGGNTFTGLTRSLFGTTANASVPSGTTVYQVAMVQSTSTSVLPSFLQVWKGNLILPSQSQLYDVDTVATGVYFEGSINVAGRVTSGSASITNCLNSASPAVCGVDQVGGVAVPAGTNPTLVVDTSAISTFGSGANVQLTVDQSLGASLSVTCNTTTPTGPPVVTARVSGTSFTIMVPGTFTTNPICVNYRIN